MASTRRFDEGIGARLQDGTAALLDLCRPVGDAVEEGVDLLPDLRRRAEAGICRDFLADPAPDGLVSVEIRAVRG